MVISSASTRWALSNLLSPARQARKGCPPRRQHEFLQQSFSQRGIRLFQCSREWTKDGEERSPPLGILVVRGRARDLDLGCLSSVPRPPGYPPPMTPRTLGAGGPSVSAVGMGCMYLSIHGRPSEGDAVRTLHAALDAGVTLLDTADVYCLDHRDIGHNERLIARALREKPGARVIVATKGGLERPNGAWTRNARPSHLRRPASRVSRRWASRASTSTSSMRPIPRCPSRRAWESSRGSARKARSARRPLERDHARDRGGARDRPHRERPEPMEPRRPQHPSPTACCPTARSTASRFFLTRRSVGRAARKGLAGQVGSPKKRSGAGSRLIASSSRGCSRRAPSSSRFPGRGASRASSIASGRLASSSPRATSPPSKQPSVERTPGAVGRVAYPPNGRRYASLTGTTPSQGPAGSDTSCSPRLSGRRRGSSSPRSRASTRSARQR